MGGWAAEGLAGRIHELARGREAPFYVYDTALVRARCRDFAAISWPRTQVHFATMANASAGFLRVVREAGLNAFVNSREHLATALEVGWRGEQIVYTASAMDEATMRQVREAGAIVNLDSTRQLERWWALFAERPVGIRCNIGELVAPRPTRAGYFLGRDSRLGLSVPEIRALRGDRRISGLHLYVGTDLTDLDYFEECYRRLAELAGGFPGLQFLDFGGGFGLPDGQGKAFDFARYGQIVSEVMREASRAAGRELLLILEPGRLLAGQAGCFVCRVTDVKEREGLQFVGANASSAQFPRPLFYPEEARHPAVLLSPAGALKNGSALPSRVYGCSTYSRDYLARDVTLPRAEVGDLVVFGNAGAYCASAHTRFLGFPEPEEVFV